MGQSQSSPEAQRRASFDGFPTDDSGACRGSFQGLEEAEETDVSLNTPTHTPRHRGLLRAMSLRSTPTYENNTSSNSDEQERKNKRTNLRRFRTASARVLSRHQGKKSNSLDEEEEEKAEDVILEEEPEGGPAPVSPVATNSASIFPIPAPFDVNSPPSPHNKTTVTFESTPSRHILYRDNSGESSSSEISEIEDDEDDHYDFYPVKDASWMGRSIETLIFGHLTPAPILQDDADDDADGDYDFYAFRRRSTASTFNGRRRSSAGSFPGGHRGSLSLSGNVQGGTLANYHNRRRQVPTDVDRTNSISNQGGDRQSRRSSTGPMYRRRSSMAASGSSSDEMRNSKAGPNVLFNIMARESTGKSCFPRGIPESQRLRLMGGDSLFAALDKPAAGMASEVALLAASIDTGDWTETHAIVSRLVVRLIGDPGITPEERRAAAEDPNLPPTAHKYYAGGGRLGLERDAFVQSGGVQVLIRMFREKPFVGQEMACSYDARDLSESIVATRLAPCWNETLASLRELVYFMPSLVEDGTVSDGGDFLPFLFTLLSHDSCFDSAAALIEELLSFMSQTQQQPASQEGEEAGHAQQEPQHMPRRMAPASTFFLGNVPDLYKLWRGFNCRQLAHFCRILALLVFEPEDRQLLESPAVLKSLELLQLRRNRAARAGRDSTVDMNQAILLGDEELIKRLLKLLSVMNYAPPLRRFSPYHVMAHFPFVADTLVMLGLSELESWDEISRQDRLARRLLEETEPEPMLSELGAVADMLEGLSDTLMDSRQSPNQIGHIIHVISAAQQAGVIVGRNRNRRAWRHRRNGTAPDSAGTTIDEQDDAAPAGTGDVPVDGSTIHGLASVAGILTDQILVRRLYQGTGQDAGGSSSGASVSADGLRIGGVPGGLDPDDSRNESRHLINTPEDSANCLQFNAMLLGPYQVEVLFVLCTLLGGRRKLDAQDTLNKLGVISVLECMFQRLPWHKQESSEERQDSEPTDREDPANQPNGIHGPGCECTPESALCVQYLRMLHNFCDRDCDNYEGRRLLLSDDERLSIFGRKRNDGESPKPGLLSKIIDAFIGESDESPYRFWLASCVESYLRGSSPEEQMFVARTGLLEHLVGEISSDRLHCAGSLQTSFDLLGELGKGNAEVVRLLVHDLDEESFRKLMSVAAANLVDSNVFIRSLLLSLERLSARDGVLPLYMDATTSSLPSYRWRSPIGNASRSYLTHSWWDATSIMLPTDDVDTNTESESANEERPSDWFPSRDLVEANNVDVGNITMIPTGLSESVGHFGWVFTPVGNLLTANAYLPNTLERLSWFLAANQARLLRDLLGVVDLRNINHENICCLNTAVVIAIFAHRRKQLALLLEELRQMNDEEKETKRRALAAAQHDDVVDRAFAQAVRYLDLSQRESPPYARAASLANTAVGSPQIGDRSDVMRNFREVLWFWMEYYTHRGRDRLSLEFSSHIRFQEWNHVVSLLAADDGSSTSLVRAPVRLPRSPYQRAAARVADSPIPRGE